MNELLQPCLFHVEDLKVLVVGNRLSGKVVITEMRKMKLGSI